MRLFAQIENKKIDSLPIRESTSNILEIQEINEQYSSLNNLDNDVVTPKTPEQFNEDDIEENLNQSMGNVSLEDLEQPNEQIYQVDHNFKSMDKLNESACAEINSLKFDIPIELSREKQTKIVEAILTHDDELYDLTNKELILNLNINLGNEYYF